MALCLVNQSLSSMASPIAVKRILSHLESSQQSHPKQEVKDGLRPRHQKFFERQPISCEKYEDQAPAIGMMDLTYGRCISIHIEELLHVLTSTSEHPPDEVL